MNKKFLFFVFVMVVTTVQAIDFRSLTAWKTNLMRVSVEDDAFRRVRESVGDVELTRFVSVYYQYWAYVGVLRARRMDREADSYIANAMSRQIKDYPLRASFEGLMAEFNEILGRTNLSVFDVIHAWARIGVMFQKEPTNRVIYQSVDRLIAQLGRVRLSESYQRDFERDMRERSQAGRRGREARMVVSTQPPAPVSAPTIPPIAAPVHFPGRRVAATLQVLPADEHRGAADAESARLRERIDVLSQGIEALQQENEQLQGQVDTLEATVAQELSTKSGASDEAVEKSAQDQAELAHENERLHIRIARVERERDQALEQRDQRLAELEDMAGSHADQVFALRQRIAELERAAIHEPVAPVMAHVQAPVAPSAAEQEQVPDAHILQEQLRQVEGQLEVTNVLLHILMERHHISEQEVEQIVQEIIQQVEGPQ